MIPACRDTAGFLACLGTLGYSGYLLYDYTQKYNSAENSPDAEYYGEMKNKTLYYIITAAVATTGSWLLRNYLSGKQRREKEILNRLLRSYSISFHKKLDFFAVGLTYNF